MKNLLNLSEIKVEFVPKFKLSECPQVHNSIDAYKVFMQVWDKSLMDFLEEFKVILLDSKNRVLGIADIHLTGKRSMPMDLKSIFSIALKASASKIVLAHNRLSERLSLDPIDRTVMDRVTEIGRILGVELFDYLIVTSDDYISVLDGECFL